MVIIIFVCIGFGSSQHIINAYGFTGFSPLLPSLYEANITVATVMFVTSTLITMVMYFVWDMKFIFPLIFFLVFGGLDGSFWAATIRKIPQGAWFPLLVGVVMTLLMALWRWEATRSLVGRLLDFFEATWGKIRGRAQVAFSRI